MYCTLDDLKERYGVDEVIGLTDRDGDDQADAALVDAIIADVDAEIDGYLAGRYELPLNPVPRLLKRLACTLVREGLYQAQGAKLADDNPVKTEAKASRQVLRDISASRAHLPVSTHAGGGSSEVEMQSDDVAWRRKDSAGYI